MIEHPAAATACVELDNPVFVAGTGAVRLVRRVERRTDRRAAALRASDPRNPAVVSDAQASDLDEMASVYRGSRRSVQRLPAALLAAHIIYLDIGEANVATILDGEPEDGAAEPARRRAESLELVGRCIYNEFAAGRIRTGCDVLVGALVSVDARDVVSKQGGRTAVRAGMRFGRRAASTCANHQRERIAPATAGRSDRGIFAPRESTIFSTDAHEEGARRAAEVHGRRARNRR